MNLEEYEAWFKAATLEEIIDSVIWSSVMEGTAWCGWTDRARKGFVEQVQEAVKFALKKKEVL